MERVVRPKQESIPIECWISAAEWLEFGDASSMRLVSKPFCDVVRLAMITDYIMEFAYLWYIQCGKVEIAALCQLFRFAFFLTPMIAINAAAKTRL